MTSELPTGKIAASEDIQYSSADSIDIRVHGVATHGAAPHRGRDPVYLASQIVVGLQGIISREKGPLDPGVITVGAIHGGQKHNIIPEFVDLQLTVRANSKETRDMLIAAIERLASGIASANGLPGDKLPTVKVIEGTPVTVNDAALARRLLPERWARRSSSRSARPTWVPRTSPFSSIPLSPYRAITLSWAVRTRRGSTPPETVVRPSPVITRHCSGSIPSLRCALAWRR